MRGELTARVVEFIRTAHAEGSLRPGQYVPSERELAVVCRVSRVTARRALQRLVQGGVLVPEDRRGYRLAAVSEAKPEGLAPQAIVFVHTHSENEILLTRRVGRIWAGARQETDRAGLVSLITCIVHRDMTWARARELARIAGGVISDEPDKNYLRTLIEAGIRVVQVDYHRHADLGTDAVVQDDAGGIFQAVQYLFRHGHRRIGYIDTTPRYRAEHRSLNAEQRLAGFKSAVRQLGIAVECVIQPCTASAARMTERFLKKGVTALVFPHTDYWLAVYGELERRGIRIPSDFGVVVWGAQAQPESGIPAPTTIVWDQERMGREAVRRLIQHLRGENPEPVTILIPCQLVDRGTGGRGPETGSEERMEEVLAGSGAVTQV
ncbi:MAG: substrate-binding domain-containing protein [Kiritimatiellia bacterium]